MTEVLASPHPKEITTKIRETESALEITFSTSSQEACWLHWGVSRRRSARWERPPEHWWPEGTQPFDEKAVESPFRWDGEQHVLTVTLPSEEAYPYLVYVVRYPQQDVWDNNHGKDYYVPLREPSAPENLGSELMDEIVQAEMGKHSWTLMHRYQLCADLLDRAQGDPDALATLATWLRYSAIRQLDWQRKYNTKPRELSHAQDVLTLKLTECFVAHPHQRDLIRLMVTSVGRGGEGQQIRDEILAIMHRHRIKEVSGHFMEEWHQKLHNNTTPDDIAICEAYLEFLKSDGNLDRFYETLQHHGVTQERLASFERPIVTPPDFVPHLKDGLIHDFEHFLGLLRAIHSGTDLESAAGEARDLLDDNTHSSLDTVVRHRTDPQFPLLELAGHVTAVRNHLLTHFDGHRDLQEVRRALFLDLSLEATLRARMESDLDTGSDAQELVELLEQAVSNLRFTEDSNELKTCQEDWNLLRAATDGEREAVLQGLAQIDRLQRAVGSLSDQLYQTIQPKAETLGKAFEAEPWTIEIFGEAVVRGQLGFVVSLILRYLDPKVRKRAGLGGWQVISRGEAQGRVQVVGSLKELAAEDSNDPLIVVAHKVKGDEEPPSGITAVITPDSVDLVSHVAVRARNIPLLFATCYEPDTLERLRDLQGQWARLHVTSSGDVHFEAIDHAADPTGAGGHGREAAPVTIRTPQLSTEPLLFDTFENGRVGGKSLHLKKLKQGLPHWLAIPRCFALPFGTFEATLDAPANGSLKARYTALLEKLDEDPTHTLASLRQVVTDLEIETGLKQAIQKTWEESELRKPPEWDEIWKAILSVWASKWNDRAYTSRQSRGIDHDAIRMAVLVQELIKMDYAFVIHTVNPFSGNPKELYAEAVVGLCETLVGNFPGRALSFTADKTHLTPKLLSFPSKSVALEGDGAILRSDSNAEDLEGYAGAGLYDSIAVPPLTEIPMRYATDPLFQNPDFRTRLLKGIAQAGTEIEALFDGPQDIEGGYADGQFYIVQSRAQVVEA